MKDFEMTKFNKELFNFDGMYLTYGADRRFVARFKRSGMGSFKSFLIKNFTVEQYFYFTETLRHPPLTVLELKGYVSPAMKKAKKLGII
jgi:hypothetical protein